MSGPALHPTDRPRLAGIELPEPLLARLRDRHGLAELPAGGPSGAGAADLVAVGVADADAIRRAFRQGARTVVELCTGDDHIPDGALRSVRRPSGLHLCLTTASAFSLDTSAIVSEALCDAGAVESPRRHEVELALHEALTNAVVHGNLGIPKGPADTARAFNAFYAEVRRRLADPARAYLRVAIDAAWEPGILDLSVTDEGEGYDFSAVEAGRVDAKSGRGLQIMREMAQSVSVTEDGRRLSLRFVR
ncbi:MAG TPA: ATP-binding protein [Azospirillaceae bacterium]|nr:ATP-binding protein [Azospirillaceae bacterium]